MPDRMRVRIEIQQVRDQILELREQPNYTTEAMLDLYGQHERLTHRLKEIVL